jgi:NhaA family Na+:H+ antiporter
VLLALTIPFTARSDDEKSPSYVLEHHLHKPVAYGIMPIFAVCNTGIVIGSDWLSTLTSSNSLGIMLGLLIGKFIGVASFSFLAVKIGLCQLPSGMTWRHVFGAGFLAGIGFTMSIFITNLAFSFDPKLVNDSIMAVLIASVISGTIGYVWLLICGKGKAASSDVVEEAS